MSTTETDAQKAKEAEKAAADAKRAEAAKAKEEERKAKAEAKAAEKAKRDQEKAEAKAARDQEKITKAATEGGVDLDSIKGSGDAGKVTLGDVREAVKVKKAEERKNRPKKAALTLSQRRSLLVLGDGPVVPKTDFNRLPLDYLVTVGLAQVGEAKVDETYTETETKDVEIPEAERVEGGPTTKSVKEKVEKTRQVTKPQFTLTDLGKERLSDINPKWRDWRPEKVEASA